MYGKLFATMYDGTLGTRGPWQALVCFQQLVILADQDGIVDMTPEAISRRTTIPLEIIEKGLAMLEQPDPDSRSPDEKGRRIVRLSNTRSWGWRIVNYAKYRSIRTAEERRDYMRKYQRARRAKAAVNAVNRPSTKSTNSSKQKQKANTPTPPPAPRAGGDGGRVRKQKPATPVSAAFSAYQDGIKQRYNAEYPPSAKANGQLANVVARVGKDLAVDVVKHYLAHPDPFYARTKHGLGYLVRDCEKFALELQAAPGVAPPTKAEAGMEFSDGRRTMLVDDYPPGDALAIARQVFKSYSSMGAMRAARNIYVRQGKEQRLFAIEELTR